MRAMPITFGAEHLNGLNIFFGMATDSICGTVCAPTSFPRTIRFWSIAFPREVKEGQVLTLPFHQFHLWYLFAILLFEVILGRCISLISSIKGFHILFLVPLLHAMVIVLQQRGYLLTPVFINAKSIMSFIVYFTWYLSGFVVSGKEKLFNGTIKRHWYIVAIVILIGYFGSKVILLASEFQNLILLCQFGLGLFDALIPLVVLLIWKALIELKYFDSSRFGNRSKLIRGFILQNALWIYIIQIPIIFWILALFHNCGFWDITSLNKMAHVGLAENIQPFLHWMVLTVITGLIIWVFVKLFSGKIARSKLLSLHIDLSLTRGQFESDGEGSICPIIPVITL